MYRTAWTRAVLADDKLSLFRRVAIIVLMLSVYKAYNISVLLYATRFPQVAHKRPLVFPLFALPVELGKGENSASNLLSHKLATS